MRKIALIVSLFGITLSACGGGGGGSPAPAQAQTLGTESVVVMTGVIFGNFTSSDIDGVAVASCPIDQTIVSASCFCGIGSGAGHLFNLETLGNAAVCGCATGPGPLQPVDAIARCSRAILTTVLATATLQKPQASTLPTLPDEATIARWADEIAAEEARLLDIRDM